MSCKEILLATKVFSRHSIPLAYHKPDFGGECDSYQLAAGNSFVEGVLERIRYMMRHANVLGYADSPTCVGGQQELVPEYPGVGRFLLGEAAGKVGGISVVLHELGA